MADNNLAPPNMPWLWQPNSPVGQPNGLGPPMLNYAAPPNPAAPTVGQGVAQTAADVAQAWPSVEEQRRMLQPLPGWQGTAVDAAKQWAEGVMMGTTAPGEAPGFSLEKVQRRRFAPPNEHIWQIKDPAGGNAGTIDTTWNPDTGNLHIEDFQSEGGPNTLGPAAIRQLRSALLEQYPGVQSLSGLRISGATYAHKNSGSGPGRYASQSIQDVEPAAGTTAPGDVPPPGIVAYHGSPADFNRFDDRFIGTGEGAQAYGRGHYFGGAEETGRNYRDALTPETIPNPEFNAAQQEYNAKYGAVGNAAGATDAEFNAAIAARDAAHEKMKSLPPTIPNPAFPGHMYQVNIGADPEHFLDWDKPLSEQSQHVQDALGKVPWTEPYLQSGKFPGSQIAPKTPEGAQQLRDAGVAGIRYLDQGSRGAGQGTHNYVVFDPATIEILRKYGLAGLIAGGGAAAAGTQQQQPSQ